MESTIATSGDTLDNKGAPESTIVTSGDTSDKSEVVPPPETDTARDPVGTGEQHIPKGDSDESSSDDELPSGDGSGGEGEGEENESAQTPEERLLELYPDLDRFSFVKIETSFFFNLKNNPKVAFTRIPRGNLFEIWRMMYGYFKEHPGVSLPISRDPINTDGILNNLDIIRGEGLYAYIIDKESVLNNAKDWFDAKSRHVPVVVPAPVYRRPAPVPHIEPEFGKSPQRRGAQEYTEEAPSQPTILDFGKLGVILGEQGKEDGTKKGPATLSFGGFKLPESKTTIGDIDDGYKDLKARITQFVAEMAKLNKHEKIKVVSNGGTIDELVVSLNENVSGFASTILSQMNNDLALTNHVLNAMNTTITTNIQLDKKSSVYAEKAWLEAKQISEYLKSRDATLPKPKEREKVVSTDESGLGDVDMLLDSVWNTENHIREERENYYYFALKKAIELTHAGSFKEMLPILKRALHHIRSVPHIDSDPDLDDDPRLDTAKIIEAVEVRYANGEFCSAIQNIFGPILTVLEKDIIEQIDPPKLVDKIDIYDLVRKFQLDHEKMLFELPRQSGVGIIQSFKDKIETPMGLLFIHAMMRLCIDGSYLCLAKWSTLIPFYQRIINIEAEAETGYELSNLIGIMVAILMDDKDKLLEQFREISNRFSFQFNRLKGNLGSISEFISDMTLMGVKLNALNKGNEVDPREMDEYVKTFLTTVPPVPHIVKLVLLASINDTLANCIEPTIDPSSSLHRLSASFVAIKDIKYDSPPIYFSTFGFYTNTSIDALLHTKFMFGGELIKFETGTKRLDGIYAALGVKIRDEDARLQLVLPQAYPMISLAFFALQKKFGQIAYTDVKEFSEPNLKYLRDFHTMINIQHAAGESVLSSLINDREIREIVYNKFKLSIAKFVDIANSRDSVDTMFPFFMLHYEKTLLRMIIGEVQVSSIKLLLDKSASFLRVSRELVKKFIGEQAALISREKISAIDLDDQTKSFAIIYGGNTTARNPLPLRPDYKNGTEGDAPPAVISDTAATVPTKEASKAALPPPPPIATEKTASETPTATTRKTRNDYDVLGPTIMKFTGLNKGPTNPTYEAGVRFCITKIKEYVSDGNHFTQGESAAILKLITNAKGRIPSSIPNDLTAFVKLHTL
jgi:hypothetical protein